MRYLYILSDGGGSWPVLRTKPIPAAASGIGVRFIGVCDEDDLAQELFEAAQILASRLGPIADRSAAALTPPEDSGEKGSLPKT
jgi:hypothetical protein